MSAGGSELCRDDCMKNCACLLQEMENGPRKVGFLPVVAGGMLVGIVTLHGLVSAGL